MIDFLKRLLAFVRPYRTRMVLGILAGIGFGLSGALLMLAVKVVIDLIFPAQSGTLLAGQVTRMPAVFRGVADTLVQILPRAPPGVIGTLVAVATIPLIMLLRSACVYMNFYFMNWVAIRAIMDMRQRLFEHLQHLSLDFFHRSSTGDLISRISNDTHVLHKTISQTVPTLVKDPVSVLTYMGLLFWQQPKLTLVSLAVIPVCMVPIVIYGRKVRKSTVALQTNFAELTSLMEESFTGVRVVKAYNLEETMLAKFAANTRKYIAHFMRVIRSMEMPGVLIEFMGSIGVALVFLYVKLYGGAHITPGDFLQFVGTVFLMYQPIKAVSRLHGQMEQARAASDRVFELMDLHPSVLNPPSPVPLRATGVEIVFDHLSFAYKEKPVLQEINLVVQPGQHVALVGPSGAGKTTLANLLLRFYDPTSGALRIGGTDLRRVAMADLRRQIAIVTQEIILFNDTLRQNIAYGRPGANEDEIITAAKRAHAHGFILEKPNGYDTVIGEKGVTLSGGQRQRIAIARAILKNAPILILDEATSALDAESERAVQAALVELMKGHTTISIAHRLSTIQKADMIVVLDKGRIVEMGRHHDLLRRDGHYSRLYALAATPNKETDGFLPEPDEIEA